MTFFNKHLCISDASNLEHNGKIWFPVRYYKNDLNSVFNVAYSTGELRNDGKSAIKQAVTLHK